MSLCSLSIFIATWSSTLYVDRAGVELNLFVCAPFGHYELVMDIEGFSDESSSRRGLTSWEVEDGPNEVRSTQCTDSKKLQQQYKQALKTYCDTILEDFQAQNAFDHSERKFHPRQTSISESKRYRYVPAGQIGTR